jgi:hypothetical protein
VTKQATWLRRAIAISIAAHVALGVVGRWALPRGASDGDGAGSSGELADVDVDVAPEAPDVEALPEEHERAKAAAAAEEQAAAAAAREPEDRDGYAAAPVDAAIADAPVDARVPVDARPDAAVPVDAPTPTVVDAAALVAEADAGSGSAGSGSAGSGSAGSGDEGSAQIAMGSATGDRGSGSGFGPGSGSGELVAMSGSGSGGSDAETAPGVDGAPTTAGTAANLVAYFPPGHVVTALVRFDRLRGTEWAVAAETIFKPLPDYKMLFAGGGKALLADKLDMLVVSTPRPRDIAATVLVAKTSLTRSELRDYLGGAITWSASRGGLLGRQRRPFAGDKRVVLSPFHSWFVLGPPGDLPNLAAASGDLDAIEATERLPPWLSNIRSIEAESGSDARGPAIVATFAPTAKRYDLPELGLGVPSIPGPERISAAMELVTQGWLVRGNIKMATEADAQELVASLSAVQTRCTTSIAHKLLLKKAKLLDAITNLHLARTGDRISYTTSLSIADTRVLLVAIAKMVEDYFKSP